MQQAVELVSKGLTLRGFLHRPKNINNDVPLIISFHGFSGNKVDAHFLHVHFSRAMEARGLASLRFDFGGSGESDGVFEDMTFSGEITEGLHILDYAQGLDGIDKNRMGLVGHSMGGAVASMVAARRPGEVSALCLWAAAGNFGTLIRTGDLSPYMNKALETGQADFNGLVVKRRFVEDVYRMDAPQDSIYNKAAAYGGPVLLVHGDKDLGVPMSSSWGYMETYGGRARLEVIEGADHAFNHHLWESEVIERTGRFFAGVFA